MENLFSQITALAKSADESGRKKVIDGLRDLAISLEGHQDSAQRVMYGFELVAVRIACDLNLFETLVDSPTPLTTTQLSEQKGTSFGIMDRICRYLASVRIIKETDKSTYTKNNVTEALTIKGFRGGVYHYFDFVGPALKALPDFLKEKKYQDLTSSADTPLQKAWNTDKHAFQFYPTLPDTFAHFGAYMVDQRRDMPTWLDVYPYKEAASGLSPDRVFAVDVGGGFGHQSIALRQALPDLTNKIVLEDLSDTLALAPQFPGVEKLEQDFFTEQKVKGAKIYYMRNVLHDWPDAKCVEILKNLKAVMAPDSVILIDEMYVPNTNAHWQSTQIDLAMMACLAALERTKDQWEALIPKAGMKINKVYQYTSSLSDSIIEVVPA